MPAQNFDKEFADYDHKVYRRLKKSKDAGELIKSADISLFETLKGLRKQILAENRFTPKGLADLEALKAAGKLKGWKCALLSPWQKKSRTAAAAKAKKLAAAKALVKKGRAMLPPKLTYQRAEDQVAEYELLKAKNPHPDPTSEVGIRMAELEGHIDRKLRALERKIAQSEQGSPMQPDEDADSADEIDLADEDTDSEEGDL